MDKKVRSSLCLLTSPITPPVTSQSDYTTFALYCLSLCSNLGCDCSFWAIFSLIPVLCLICFVLSHPHPAFSLSVLFFPLCAQKHVQWPSAVDVCSRSPKNDCRCVSTSQSDDCPLFGALWESVVLLAEEFGRFRKACLKVQPQRKDGVALYH